MTNFDKEKALTEAKRRYLDYLTDTHIELRDAFIKGARWQASQPVAITDEMVERAIKAFIQPHWDGYYGMKSALEAGLGVSND